MMSPKTEISKEKCELFLESIPLVFKHEFEDLYCPGQLYYGYAFQDPDNFIRDVVRFSKTHQDNEFFTSAALRHLGSGTRQNVNSSMNPIKKIRPEDKRSYGNTEPDDEPCNFGPYYQPQPRSGKPSSSKKTVHKSESVQTHSILELKKSILQKLFGSPRRQKRYMRLTPEERNFILDNVMFTKRERFVFMRKCKGDTYFEIAERIHFSESMIKRDAVEIDKYIIQFLKEG